MKVFVIRPVWKYARLTVSIPPAGLTLSRKDKAKIKQLNEQLYIHPEECIDCGACQPECPVDAIFPDDEVPDKWKHYIEKNYARFGLKLKKKKKSRS